MAEYTTYAFGKRQTLPNRDAVINLAQQYASQGYDPSQVAQEFSNNSPGQEWSPAGAPVASPISYQELFGYLGGGPANFNSGANQNSTEFINANNALNLQEGRIDPQLGVARSNILDQYNSAINALLGQKDRATRDYTTATDRTKQDNQQAKAKIDQNVSQQNTGIQRLLGARGAGNSSAARILAPYAAGAVGNQQRGDVQRVYGRNIQDITTKQGDFLQDWETKRGQTESDKINRLNEAEANAANARLNIAQQRQALNPYNANGYTSTINDLISRIDSLARVNTYVPPTAAYKAPELTQYGYQSAAAPAYGDVSQQATNNVGPYWTLLGNEDQQKKEQIA